MRYSVLVLATFAFCYSASVRAQSWQSLGGEAFISITRVIDGSLLVIRYPGDILRSTDRGKTWHEVYHQLGWIERFTESNNREIVARSGKNTLLVSSDSGRSWNSVSNGQRTVESSGQWIVDSGKWRTIHHPLSTIHYQLSTIILDDSSNILLSRDSGASWQCVFRLRTDYPAKLYALCLADSVCYAVGEPELMYVSDSKFAHWTELHSAPFEVDTASHRYYSSIAFWSTASGAIAAGNRIYFTHDSGTTWQEATLPDTNQISTVLMLSDTTALAGGSKGSLEYLVQTGNSYRSYDSLLPTSRTVVQIGWTNRADGKLYILTDSGLYFTTTGLESMTSQALSLHPGEFATSVSFPDPNTGYLLTDSITHKDSTIRDMGFVRDTVIACDTSNVYCTTDGGATWTLVLAGKHGLSKIFFVNAKRGFVCGANGIVLRTNDSGASWSKSFSFTRQNLHDIRFVNDSTGYVAGDSGMVLLTENAGLFCRPVVPEPLFMHPAISYTSLAFPDAHTVVVLGQNRCYTQTIRDPFNLRISRKKSLRKNPLHITISPNPSSGIVHVVVTDAGTGLPYDGTPSLRICDLSGRTVMDGVSCSAEAMGRWSAEVNLSSQPLGAYMAIAIMGDMTAQSNFVIER